MDKINNILSKTLPIYWAFLTYMLLRPAKQIPHSLFVFHGVDKVLHFLIFTLLGFLFRLRFPQQSFIKFILILFSYALITEILQGIMNLGRSMEALDLLMNTLGIISGFFGVRLIDKHQQDK
ncbi:MAG: VanZ family protein [Bergeyella cardium]